MKSKYKFLCIIAALLGMIFTGCNDAEYDIRNNSVYIAEATSAKAVNVAMEASGADVNVVVRLAKQLDYDVTVSMGLDTRLISEYNEKNSTEYVLVPAEHFSLPSDASVTIPAGDISATFKVHIENFDTQGKLYALPVIIKNVVKGEIIQSATQAQLLYLIAKPLIVSVPVMKGYNSEGVKVHPNQDWNIRTKEWTIEAWVRMSAYSKNNQAIFDNWGDGLTEVYIRFGDANSPYNYLQVKTLGGQIQTERDLVANKWYHWAFVYDGTTFSIYRDGELNIKFNPPAPQGPGGTVEFQTLTMIGSGATYFPDQCAMSQVRFWKVARTPVQIKNNMYYEVDPTNSNLIGYWPMNEGSGNTFNDITGNGNNAVAGSHIIQRWENNIRFDQ
ncbi:DUF1735 and LamG domain-containing protein [Dysgonomonas sp.]